MNSKKIAVAAMAISLATAGLAYAQGQRQADRGRNYNDRSGNQSRQFDRGPQRDRGHADRSRMQEDWRKGARVPSEYRHRHYVVNDWRGHNLKEPPRGYHWVQHGNDYVLAAIATGIIADILMNHQ